MEIIVIIGTFDYVSEMKQSSYTIPLSYQINDQLAIGSGLTYSHIELNQYVADIHGSGRVDAFYPQLGLLFSPLEFLSLGASYTFETRASRSTIDYEGDAHESVSSKILPSSYGLGCTLKPVDNLALSLEFQQKNYSKANSETYNDQSITKAGIEYSPTNFLALRLGYYNLPSYIKKGQAGYLIDTTQEFLTYGIGVNFNETMALNLGVQDSSIFKSGDIHKARYLVNLQIAI